jgi:molybdate/tungstate transport system substrate-binding protein
MKRIALPIAALLLVLAVTLTACGAAEQTEQIDLYVLYAGSLAVPYDELAQVFEAQNPDVNIASESAGSRDTIRKVTELGKPGDVIGSADYAAIEELMFPDYADWYIKFAINDVVIAYRDGAPFADEISNGSRTWYDVFINEDVAYGHSNPDADPCGYRALMVCQLAQAYYYDNASDFGLTPDGDAADLYDALIPIPSGGDDMDRGRGGGDWGEVVRSKSVELLTLMESGDLDYAFEYLSVAVQHDFDYISLPDEIDLSDEAFADFYSTATVNVTGSEPGTVSTLKGEATVYGVTIPLNAPHPEEALDFVELMLGPEGQAILNDVGQPPIVPAIASDPSKVPDQLKPYISQ